MTPTEELRMMDLEDAVIQASASIQFLYDCLENPHIEGIPGGATHMYPEQTLAHINELDNLASRPWCIHSNTRQGLKQKCESCKYSIDRYTKRSKLEQKEIDAGLT